MELVNLSAERKPPRSSEARVATNQYQADDLFRMISGKPFPASNRDGTWT
jgi:hypothetical protein